MTRITEDELRLMNDMITAIDNYNAPYRKTTKLELYELTRDYFNELAENERTKLESDYCEEKDKPRKMNCIEAMMQNIDFMMRRCEQNSSQDEVTEAIYLFLDSR